MTRLVVLITLITFSINIASAQNGYDWGENKPDAQARWQYMNFSIENKNYNQALIPLSWLLKNTPNLHVDLYKLGTKVYEKIERNEPNKTYKVALQDTILMLYDKRIELFGDEANVLNRKGLHAYNFLAKRKNTEDTLYATYKKIYELNANNTFTSAAYYYMTSACDMKKINKISNEEILEVYASAAGVFDANIAAETDAKKKESLIKFKDRIDGKLTQCADVSCEYAIEKWGKESSIAKLKMAYSILLAKNCTESTEFITITSKILEAEPSASGYKSLGDILKNSKPTEALGHYQKAINLATDDEFKGALYISMANIYSKTNKSTSKEYAQKAIALGQFTNEAHTLIGNLYVASYDQCKSDNPIDTRAVFIAAYNEYATANNTEKMKELKANFPSKEEIFQYGKKVGDKVTVGCWINVTVSLKTRD